MTQGSKNNFRNVKHELEKKMKQLVQTERVAMNGGSVLQMKKLEQEIDILLDREAKLWNQRSKVQWLKDGDRNTRIFHSKTSQCRRRNYIKGLYDRGGQWYSARNRVAENVLQFY